MVFIDYDTIEHATRGIQAHQNHKWEDGDVGLKIDYDKDARSKRSAAVDEAERFEKFWPIAPRTAKVESEAELFAQLQEQADEQRLQSLLPPRKAKRKEGKAARLQIKTAGQQGGCPEEPTTEGSAAGAAG